ncbi:hypothetical protein GCM10009114_02170 [Aliiglaciecola litoralis]|uniref:RHS repeat-associated core domain-containing protein n=1 Tax=Aliiglaciecola litoralis TaxID=582857 RepID=A0ABN1LC65_9ALTE
MNGRVYDYNVGRFMGVDPFIQEAWNSQSINPYSYILNNPLWGTDPSGYSRIKGRGISGSTFGGKAFGYWDNSKKSKATKSDNGAENSTSKSNENIPTTELQSHGNSTTPTEASVEDNENDSSEQNDTLIIHRVTGDNSPDYYKSDGTPVWIKTGVSPKEDKKEIRKPSRPLNHPRASKGYWQEIGRIYGKGNTGNFTGAHKIKINYLDEQGIALTNGMYFTVSFTALDENGKPIPTFSFKKHGSVMKMLPMGVIYEIYGEVGEKFRWNIETKRSAASCDNCGNGGIKVSEFIYE